MKKSKQRRRLLIRILLNKMEKLCEHQEQILRKGKELEKKQKNQEFWIKTTKYLTYAFIIVRTTLHLITSSHNN